MTKEEILNTKNWSSEYPNYMAENNIHDAMDEYSRQMAIAFAEWVTDNGFEMVLGAKAWDSPNFSGQCTTYELYNLFLQHQSQQS